MHQYKQINDILLARINGLKEKIVYLINNRSSCDVDFELNRCWKECDQINDIACCDIKKAKILDPCFNAFSGCDSSSYFSIYESRLRQKDAAIELSKRNLLSRMKQPHEQYERLLADKQRVIDSLSQTLTGVFQKSKRTQTSISSDVNSQQQVSLGNVRHSGYYKHEAMVDNYMTRMSRDDGKSMTSINSLDHAQENQLKQKVVGNVAHYTNNNTNNNTGVLRAGRESTLPISARQSSESSQLESNTKVTVHVETNQQNQQRNVQGTTTTVQQNSFNYVINPHVDPTISEANRPRDYHNLPDILRPRNPQLIAQYNLQTQRNNALLIHERENRVMSTSRVNESIQMSTNNVRNDLAGFRSVEAPHQQATVISRNQLTGSRTSQISQNGQKNVISSTNITQLQPRIYRNP